MMEWRREREVLPAARKDFPSLSMGTLDRSISRCFEAKRTRSREHSDSCRLELLEGKGDERSPRWSLCSSRVHLALLVLNEKPELYQKWKLPTKPYLRTSSSSLGS